MARICVLTSTFPSSPLDQIKASFALETIRHWTAKGHEVTVLTQSVGDADDRHWEGFKVIRYPWVLSGGSAVDLVPLSARTLMPTLTLLGGGLHALRAQHRTENFDLVVCLWAVPAGALAWLARKLDPQFPNYVIWALGSDINSLKGRPLGRWLLRQVLRGARGRFADGLALALDVEHISGLPCEFLPTFRNLSGIKSAQGTEDTVTRDRRRFLYVGRMEPVKGVDLLVEAILKVFEQDRALAAHFDLVGDGKLRAGLAAQVATAGLEKQVRFLGKISNAELALAYRECDCVVIPSRSESIPIVLGEAVQFKKPLIVTQVGDMGTLARQFELGTVCAPGDPGALAAAIQAFVSAPRPVESARSDEALAFLSLGSKLGGWTAQLEGMMPR